MRHVTYHPQITGFGTYQPLGQRSQEFNADISTNITNLTNFGTQISYRGEDATKQEAEHGTAVTYLRMVPLRNSLKTADTLYSTYPNHLPDQPMMNNTLTTLPTSTTYPHRWVYHGNEKKTCRLLIQPPTLASYGTSPPCGYPYL